MKTCKRFHFEDVEPGDILALTSGDGVKVTVQVSEKWSTQTFGEAIKSADGNTAWIHASRTGPGRVPTYEEMCQLHRAVWGDHGYAYQVHAPLEQHVNIHEHALHLWGRADGKPVLPEFGRFGSI